MTITFDMDNTLCALYDVPNWLDYLIAEDTTPYEIAEPMVRLSALAKRLNNLQKKGYRIAVCSWLSKCGSPDYNERVTEVKLEWLSRHLPSVHWDDVNIVPYGTPKNNYCHSIHDVLFDDTEEVRANWSGKAYDETRIFEILAKL